MTATDTSTSEFHPNIGHQQTGGAMLAVGNILYYLCTGSDYKLKLGLGDISDLVADGDLEPITEKSSWSNFNVSAKISNLNDANFKTKFVPALVLHKTRIYMFWADNKDNGKIYAVHLDLATNTWSPAAYVVFADGSTLRAKSSLSVSNINGRLRLSWFSPDSLHLQGCMLDPSEIDASRHVWDGTWADAVNLNDAGLSVDKSYYNMTADWFSQGNAGNSLVAAFYSTDKSTVQSLVIPLLVDGNTDTRDNERDPQALPSFASRKGSGVARDPAGRIYLVHGIHDSKNDKDVVNCRTLATFQEFDNKTPAMWSDPVSLEHSTKSTPCVGFVFGPQRASAVSLVGRDGQSSDLPSTEVKTYRFVFYSRNNKSSGAYDIQAQGDFYGVSNLVPDYSEQTPDESMKDFFTLTNIMDPFPFPNQNIGGKGAGDTMISYTYGTTTSTNLSAKAAWNLTFGIRSEATTTKGIGPAFDAEFKTGPSGSIATSFKTDTFKGVTMDTALAVEESNGPVVVSPQGRADGQSLPNVVETSALFYDVAGDLLSGVQSPMFSSMLPKFPRDAGPQASLYDVFSADPGDIESYSEDAINMRMKALYADLPADVRDQFPAGYATNYIEDVILPRAVALSDGRKYLSFLVEPNGGQITSFSAVDSVAVSAGWTMQSKLYVGAGYGEELSIFGAGVAGSGKTLAGFDFAMAITAGAEDQKGWGVTSAFSYPDNVPGSYGYSVQMYICRADHLWALEVQHMAQNVHQESRIDWDSSAPMKIFFVVQRANIAR